MCCTYCVSIYGFLYFGKVFSATPERLYGRAIKALWRADMPFPVGLFLVMSEVDRTLCFLKRTFNAGLRRKL